MFFLSVFEQRSHIKIQFKLSLFFLSFLLPTEEDRPLGGPRDSGMLGGSPIGSVMGGKRTSRLNSIRKEKKVIYLLLKLFKLIIFLEIRQF